jgi:hypothetical protein
VLLLVVVAGGERLLGVGSVRIAAVGGWRGGLI